MDELRRIRSERGWSQQKLADESGVNKATINQIERGKRSPNVETLERLAEALGVEVGELFPKAQSPLPFRNAGGSGDVTQAWQVYLDHLLNWTEELRDKLRFDALHIHSPEEERVVQVRLVFKEVADFLYAKKPLRHIDRNFSATLSEHPSLSAREAERLQNLRQTIAELIRRGDILDKYVERMRSRHADLRWLREQLDALEAELEVTEVNVTES